MFLVSKKFLTGNRVFEILYTYLTLNEKLYEIFDQGCVDVPPLCTFDLGSLLIFPFEESFIEELSRCLGHCSAGGVDQLVDVLTIFSTQDVLVVSINMNAEKNINSSGFYMIM